jgi:hypothetical protein
MSEEKQQSSDMDVDENHGGVFVLSGGVSEAQEATMEIAQADPEAAGASKTGSGIASNSANSQSNNAVRVMASSGTIGSVSISLHPLVIMNVSEHWTRLRAQEGSDQLGKRIVCFYLRHTKDKFKNVHFNYVK